MLRKAHDLAIEHGYAAIEERTNRLLAVQPAS
jgi:hypothetical protein